MNSRNIFFVSSLLFILLISHPGHTAIDCSSDGNNNADSALYVYPLQGLIDCVGPSDTFDFYEFDTGTGSFLDGSIIVYCAEPGLAVTLYQRGVSGDMKIVERGTKEGIYTAVFDSHALSLMPGTYLVRVTHYSAFPGDHRYHINFGLYTDGYPPDYNDTYAQAEMISLDNPTMGTVCSYDPVDWYQFDITSDYDGYGLLLENNVNDAKFTIYDGNSSTPVKLYESAAVNGADAVYAFEMSTISAGSYYVSVESSAVDPVGQPYVLGLVGYEGYLEAGYVHNPELIHVSGAPSAAGWQAKFPWQQNKSVNLGPWARIGGTPANNGLTAYRGPMSPVTRWDSQLSSDFDFNIDPMKLLDESSINVEELISGIVPNFIPSFQKILSEPVIDAGSGVLIASAIEEYVEVLEQESFSGISMADGSVLWELPGMSSHGQLILGPNSVFLLPGGGGAGIAGVAGDTGISCYSAALGNLLWSIDTGIPILDLNVINKDLFVGGDGDMVRGYSFRDGKIKWSTIGPGKPGPRSLAVDDQGNVYGNFSGFLYKYKADGTFLYKKQVAVIDKEVPLFSKTSLGPDGKVFISDTRGTVYCCRSSDGGVLWQYPKKKSSDSLGILDVVELFDIDTGDLGDLSEIEGYLQYIEKPALVVDLAVMRNGYVVIAYRKKLFVLDANGREIAKRGLNSPIGGGLTTDDAGAIYASLADEEGVYHLEAMDHKLNTIWTVEGTGACSRPAIAPNGLMYVVNNENQVVCVG